MKKSKKNLEVGGWVKPQISFLFFGGNFFFFFFHMFPNVIERNKKLDRRVGACGLTNPSFSQIFVFF